MSQFGDSRSGFKRSKVKNDEDENESLLHKAIGRLRLEDDRPFSSLANAIASPITSRRQLNPFVSLHANNGNLIETSSTTAMHTITSPIASKHSSNPFLSTQPNYDTMKATSSTKAMHTIASPMSSRRKIKQNNGYNIGSNKESTISSSGTINSASAYTSAINQNYSIDAVNLSTDETVTRYRYVSKGSANGRLIYQGPNGGLFYFTPSGNKTYI